MLESSFDILSMSFNIMKKQFVRRVGAQITFINCEKGFKEKIDNSFYRKFLRPITKKDREWLLKSFSKDLNLLVARKNEMNVLRK